MEPPNSAQNIVRSHILQPIVSLDTNSRSRRVFVLTASGNVSVVQNESSVHATKFRGNVGGMPTKIAYDWVIDRLLVVRKHKSHYSLEACRFGNLSTTKTVLCLF